jgi:hypothetical protein
VSVDDVEPELACDLYDFVGQRQNVLRFTKQRIARRIDLMKYEARVVLAEPKGRIRADDVDVMAPVRQRLSELRRDDAAAADRCVTNDAYVHVSKFTRFRRFKRFMRFTGS